MAFVSPTNLRNLHNASQKQNDMLEHEASISDMLAKRSLSKKRAMFQVGKQGRLEIPLIPDPSIFGALPKEDPGHTALPTTSECAVHLEMLEVFHVLRHQVIQSKELDELFGIRPNRKTVYRKTRKGRNYIAEKVSLRDPTFHDRRKLKWAYFLRLAAERFHEWMKVVEKHLSEAKARSTTPPSRLLLPPLDVLVVWHAFLLNCSDFEDYCTRTGLQRVQEIVFPWGEIHAAIDPDKWTYALPQEHAKWLLDAGVDPDLFDALLEAGKVGGIARKMIFKYITQEPHNTSMVSQGKAATGRMAVLAKIARGASAREQENTALVENVERQCVFVDKMHAHRWIRSPAVKGTLRRAVDRYDKFLHLFRLYPYQFLVPTLDVDLVWHTHQCSAEHYRQFVTERVGRFINHEDKIGRGTLDDGFTRTDEWYRLRFGEQYQVCLCWSCEAILSAVEEREEDGVLDTDVELVLAVEEKVRDYREVEVYRRMGKLLI